MSPLEKRYRCVLRLLPAAYRAEREEEMLCALLEGDRGPRGKHNSRPHWSEIVSIAALSLRVRLGGVGAAPRYLAWGQTVRMIAVLGLFFHAMMSCFWFADFLRPDGGFHSFYRAFYGDHPLSAVIVGPAERLWAILRGFADLLWIAAFIALIRGRPRTAKILVVLALVPFYPAIFPGSGGFTFSTGSTAALHTVLFGLPVLALLAGFHRDAPRISRPAVFIAAGLPLYLALSPLYMILLRWSATSQLPPAIDLWSAWMWWAWWDVSAVACLMLVIASAACIAAYLSAPVRRTACLPLALALAALAVPVTFARLIRLNFQTGGPLTFGHIGPLVALLLCALMLAVLGARTMSALPRETPPPPVKASE
ncbi:hypothetical protein PS9374_02733 [Planomonospora sphaerica]|uniref:Uncharacterized protein n=1 Tax=Planomonospora sphaerica TaxID=161355 RepID=A0A171CQT5_9ACTN|nr:hypothetical protein [Planomonospora sphaerica]GAT67080.1 hypothetical protein PS9374_02733 [Planomonospora sphaerica]